MKRIICNQCRKEDIADGVYASAPEGWLSVTRSKNHVFKKDDADRYADLHLCSLSCFVRFGQEQLGRDLHAEAPVADCCDIPPGRPYTPTLGDA